jgi:hypothetical protein
MGGDRMDIVFSYNSSYAFKFSIIIKYFLFYQLKNCFNLFY